MSGIRIKRHFSSYVFSDGFDQNVMSGIIILINFLIQNFSIQSFVFSTTKTLYHSIHHFKRHDQKQCLSFTIFADKAFERSNMTEKFCFLLGWFEN